MGNMGSAHPLVEVTISAKFEENPLTHYLTVAPLYSFTSYRMVTLKCSFIENRMITPLCAMRTTVLFVYMMALKQGHFLSFSENQTPVAVTFPFLNCIVYF